MWRRSRRRSCGTSRPLPEAGNSHGAIGGSMFTRESRPARIDTLIGKAARVHGDVEFQGGLHLDGHIAVGARSGRAPDATPSVSASCSIAGPVGAPNVGLEGRVKRAIQPRGGALLGAATPV